MKIFRHKFWKLALILASAGLAMPASAAEGMDGFEKRVQRIFERSYADICSVDDLVADGDRMEVFRTTFNYRDEDYDPRPFALVRFHCYYGAYNETHVYYSVDDYGEIRQVQFATPEFDVTFVDDDDAGEIDSITVPGFSAYDLLVNSTVDPETLTIVSASRWRGLGDASSSGEWVFRDSVFVLVAYDIDPTYDGKINPRRIYGDGPPSYGDE